MVRKLRVNVLFYHDEEKDAQDDRMDVRYPPNPWLSDAEDETSWIARMRVAQHELSGTEMLVLLAKALAAFENLDTLELEAVIVTQTVPETGTSHVSHRPLMSDSPDTRSSSDLPNSQLRVTPSPQNVDHLRPHTVSRKGPEEIKRLPWRMLWTRTMQAYQVLMAAVSRARLKSLERLQIYWETRKCAVLALDLAQFLTVPENADGFAFVAAHLKEFAITVGTDLVGGTEQGVYVRGKTDLYDPCVLHFNVRDAYVETWEDEAGELHVTFRNALMPLLRHLSPLLRTFQLRLFNSNSHVHAEDYTTIMRPMIGRQGLFFPHLEKLSLRGLSPTNDTLHRFIRKHASHLQELELDNITLHDENQWTDLFQLISQRCVSLETLRLGYLRTNNINNMSRWQCLDITPANEAFLQTPTWKWTVSASLQTRVSHNVSANRDKSYDSWRAFHPGPGRVYYVARKIRKEEIRAGLSHKGLVNVPGRDAAGDRWLKALQAEYGPIH
jgi:hypothetical protein